jgi:TonB family protein
VTLNLNFANEMVRYTILRTLLSLVTTLVWVEAYAQSSLPQPAKILRMPSSDTFYPSDAKKAGRQGTATVKACVSPGSAITSVELITPTGHPDLDESAIALGKQGVYEAGKSTDGTSLPSCVMFRVKFEIDRGAYEGGLIDGKRSGRGIAIYKNAAKYVGEWRDDERNGQGELTLPDGTNFDGTWEGDSFVRGALTLPDGTIWDGNWESDVFVEGALKFPDGSKYVGEFKNWLFDGQGSFTWPSGAKFVGEYRENKRNGQGIEYSANGLVKASGIWRDDRLSQAFAIDTARFPFERDAAAEARVKELEKASSEIDALRQENSLLRQRIEELQKKAKPRGAEVVQECLARGLRPGSRQFSDCIGQQK